MARLFFAVGVSGDATPALVFLCSKLKKSTAAECLRFVAIDQAHYTLRFLGEEPPERQAAAARAGRAAAAGAEGFELVPRELGVFPDERRPHTLWIGAGEGASALAAVAGKLESQLVAEGFWPEPRPFVPHLTLARVKGRPPRDSMRSLLSEPREPLPPLTVESFALMESRPIGGTVRYIALETFRLEIPCTPSKSPSTAAPK